MSLGKCFVHIGGPKTGTTALQTWLSSTAERTLHYPRTLRMAEDPYGHHLISRDIQVWHADTFRELQSTNHVVLFSSESLFPFSRPEAAALDRFVDFCSDFREVEVIATLRTPDVWMLRWAQQLMLEGHILDAGWWGAAFSFEFAFVALDRLRATGNVSVSLFQYHERINEELLAYLGAKLDSKPGRSNVTPRLDKSSWEFLSAAVRAVEPSARFNLAMVMANEIGSRHQGDSPTGEWFRREDIERWRREIREGVALMRRGGLKEDRISGLGNSDNVDVGLPSGDESASTAFLPNSQRAIELSRAYRLWRSNSGTAS